MTFKQQIRSIEFQCQKNIDLLSFRLFSMVFGCQKADAWRASNFSFYMYTKINIFINMQEITFFCVSFEKTNVNANALDMILNIMINYTRICTVIGYNRYSL